MPEPTKDQTLKDQTHTSGSRPEDAATAHTAEPAQRARSPQPAQTAQTAQTARSPQPAQTAPPVCWSTIDSPVGALFAAVSEGAVVELSFLGDEQPSPPVGWIRDDGACDELRSQLEQYFAGERREFDIEIAPDGTEFQMQVWTALRSIPYGRTASYGEIAARIGRPRAVRAVGGANNANPISIIVPCHRVIGADGSLTGYGGGLGTKATLLALESPGVPET